MKKGIRVVLMVLILAAAGGGGYWIYQNQVASSAKATAAASGAYTQVVQVKKGTLDATVSVVGQLEAEQRASLAFEQMSDTTNLLTLAVQAGSAVTKGQTLATIDDAPYEQALDQANSDLLAAQETLEDLQTPATALELAKADVAVAKAKVQLQKAQDTLDDLLNPDIASLELKVASAKSALAKAQANVLSQEQTAATQAQLDKLIYAESTPTAEYNRLAGETYSDAAYQDRLQLAYNKMMDAQDARVAYQLDSRSGAIQAQMSLRKAQANLADAEEALADAQAGGGRAGRRRQTRVGGRQGRSLRGSSRVADSAGSADGAGRRRGCERSRDGAGGCGQEAVGGERCRGRAGRHETGGAL